MRLPGEKRSLSHRERDTIITTMGVCLLIVYNRSGDLLLSRFYGENMTSLNTTAIMELKILEHFRIYFNSSSEAPVKKCVTLADIHLLMDFMGELYFVVGGTDDCDEIVLSDVMDCIRGVVTDQLDGKITESNLLEPDNYGKVSVVLDEVVPNGIIESLNSDVANKMAKLKELN